MPFVRKLGGPTPWTEKDVVALRNFLSSENGIRFTAKLFALRPKPTERSEAVKRSIQSGVLEGYEELIYQIEKLCRSDSVDRAKNSNAEADNS